MDLLATLAAAMRGAKATTELLQAALAIKVDDATLTKINDALHQVRIIQDALFEAQQELFKLQQENYELRQEQNARNDWDNTKAGYRREKTMGGAVLYKSISDSPGHFACPRCFADRQIQILQDTRSAAGT
jgi:hypothetical protein